MTIDKKEIKYIIYSGIFLFVWFMFIIPYFGKSFEQTSPFTAFLVFNIGLYIFFFIFLKALVTNSSINFKTALGLLILSIGTDILLPDYHVLSSGTLVIGTSLGQSASDYVIGFFATNIGLSGILVFLFTYLLAPIVLFLIAAYLLKNFVRYL